jgi:hypothetical protein
MKLKPEEKDLRCEWDVIEGKVVGNAVCDRIEQLISQHLIKVAGGGWETLYQDPYDGRYWELTYPQGEMHGGGPPRLTYLTHEHVNAKYGRSN